jgi:hypothetical protein
VAAPHRPSKSFSREEVLGYFVLPFSFFFFPYFLSFDDVRDPIMKYVTKLVLMALVFTSGYLHQQSDILKIGNIVEAATLDRHLATWHCRVLAETKMIPRLFLEFHHLIKHVIEDLQGKPSSYRR